MHRADLQTGLKDLRIWFAYGRGPAKGRRLGRAFGRDDLVLGHGAGSLAIVFILA